jgi:hypothetical protein
MVLPILVRRTSLASESEPDDLTPRTQPDQYGSATGIAGIMGAWRDMPRDPGTTILILALIGVSGICILVLIRDYLPWILTVLSVALACWFLRGIAPILALRGRSAVSRMASSVFNQGPLERAQFTVDAYNIDAVSAALGQTAGRTSPLLYRPAGSTAAYQFSFQQVQGLWRIYIDAQPSYGGRSDDLHSTHRLRDGTRYYICWTGSLTTLASAIRVATLWADSTHTYIATGRHF